MTESRCFVGSYVYCFLRFLINLLKLRNLQETLKKQVKASEVIFQLIEGIEFADGTHVTSIAKSEIDGLRDLPVSFGEK